MKRMSEPVELAEIPARIFQRRLENIQLLVNSVTSLFGNNADDTRIASTTQDHYGFDKTLVFLTKPNKAVAVSSLKGDLLWSRLIKDPVRRMVIDQYGGEAVLDIVTSKGQLIKIDPVTGAVRSTTALPELP